MDDDARNVLGRVEPEVLPGPPAIRRPEDALAVISAARSRSIALAEPNDFRIRRRDGQRANRHQSLFIRDWLEGCAGVGRLPDSAGPRRYVEGSRVNLRRTFGNG